MYLAGQEDYDKIRPLSYPNTDVFMLCFSIVSQNSFANVSNRWAPELFHHAPHVPVVLIGTKSDLRNDSKHNCIPLLDCEALATQIGAEGYFECSALTQDGLLDCFQSSIRTAQEVQKAQKRHTRNPCTLL